MRAPTPRIALSAIPYLASLLSIVLAAMWLSLASAQADINAIVNAYSDRELISGFNRTVFGTEDPAQRHRAGRFRVKKFTTRVRVHLINLSHRDRRAEVRRFISKLNATVKGLRITTTKYEKRAGMVVFLLDRRDYKNVIMETMPAHMDKSFLLSNDCSAVTGGRHGHQLDRAFVYIVADEGRRNFRHCMIEEIIQSLGPVNDDRRLSHSIFNDYSTVTTFAAFDWFILNMLYDRRVKAGMTMHQVNHVLPAVISDARRRLRALVKKRQIKLR